jgi:hypothetical protein
MRACVVPVPPYIAAKEASLFAEGAAAGSPLASALVVGLLEIA